MSGTGQPVGDAAGPVGLDGQAQAVGGEPSALPRVQIGDALLRMQAAAMQDLAAQVVAHSGQHRLILQQGHQATAGKAWLLEPGKHCVHIHVRVEQFRAQPGKIGMPRKLLCLEHGDFRGTEQPGRGVIRM